MATKTNVLLVDDDMIVRQSLEQALAIENFGVFPAANSLEALREFNEKRIDIVLLNLNLGQENGWDTFNKLRRIRPRLPVIIMTGHPEMFRRRASDRANALMEKPLDLPALFRKLNELAAEVNNGQPQLQSDPACPGESLIA